MQTRQVNVDSIANLPSQLGLITHPAPELLIIFASVDFFADQTLAQILYKHFPRATVIGCSTAGEIAVDRVYESHCIITAVNFEHTRVKATNTKLQGMVDSYAAGERLGQSLLGEDLVGVFVLATGVAINGSALVNGLQSALPENVNISGGLAADAGAFNRTWTLSSAGVSHEHLVAIGLYGKHIEFNYGTFAGWEAFGPERKVTRCDENILYELDGERALDIYQRYLGDYAKDLPSSGLLFPFEMLGSDRRQLGIFRTILGVDEKAGSLTLAGDIDPNGYLKLMHSSTEQLIDGAGMAANHALENQPSLAGGGLAILVSCIGRKLVMGARVDEEVEVVAEVFGNNTCVTGYYSNGEIAIAERDSKCYLHNQTMTITWINEV